MKKSFIAASMYLGLGLIAGVFYREFTKAVNFPQTEQTQLSVLHTHLLTLGFFFFLIVLGLDKLFGLSDDARFKTFFAVYNIGLVLSITMMTWHGILTALGRDADFGPELAGIAGLGHIVMSIGLGLFLLVLGPKVTKK